MKKTRKILFALVAAVMLMTVMAFAVSAETEGIYTYVNDEYYYGGIKITDVDDSASGDIVIPSQIDGIDVVALGWPCFKDCDEITSVVIPDTVKVLESSVFEDCDALEKVTMGDSVISIGDAAFYGCDSLEEIRFSDSLKELCQGVISSCPNLKTVKVPSNLEIIDDWAVVECYSLEEFEIPSTVTYIGVGAFHKSAIRSVTVPAGVTVINDRAFCACPNLEEINLPDTITEIGDFAFEGIAVTEFVVPENVKKVGEQAFYDCPNLKKVVFPDGVESIGGWCFFASTELEECNIPAGITEIPDGMFMGTKIKEVKLHPGITKIGNQAFDDCYELETLEVPGSVTEIGIYAFSDLTGLKSFKYYGTEESFKAACFSDDEYKYYKNTLKVTFEPCISNHGNIVVMPAVDPDCSNTGLTEGEKCADCGKIFVKQKSVKKLGHIDEDGDTICDRCGENAVEYCSLCGDIAHEDFRDDMFCVVINILKLIKDFVVSMFF